MRCASSASRTWRASLSASAYSAMLRKPRRRAVRMTRQAISPRFAISRRANTSALSGSPGGLALLEERGDAFLAFRRDADLGDAPRGLGDQRFIGRMQRHLADQLLNLAVGLASSGEEMLQKRLNGRIQFRGQHDCREQAEALRFARVEDLRAQEIAPRSALADGADHVGADRRRREAELRLGETELRVRRAEGDVARGDKPGAAGERRA